MKMGVGNQRSFEEEGFPLIHANIWEGAPMLPPPPLKVPTALQDARQIKLASTNDHV